MKKILLFVAFILCSISGECQLFEKYYLKPDSTYIAKFSGSQANLDSINIGLLFTYPLSFVSFGKAYDFVSNDTIRTGEYLTYYINPLNQDRLVVRPPYSSITSNGNVIYPFVYDKVQSDGRFLQSETDPLFNTKFSSKTTDDLAQGSTNKYVTATNISNWNTAATLAATAIQPSGNAATATKLATARTINGTSFDGSSNISITATPNLGAPSAGNTFTSGTAFQVNSSNPSLIIINASLAGIVGVNGTIAVALCATQSGTYTTIASDAIAIAVLGVGSKSVGTIPVPAGYWVKITLAGSTAPSATYTKLDFQ